VARTLNEDHYSNPEQPKAQPERFDRTLMRAIGCPVVSSGAALTQKCSKSPEEHNLYWTFAALSRLREGFDSEMQ
jgi:hypothetical protein